MPSPLKTTCASPQGKLQKNKEALQNAAPFFCKKNRWYASSFFMQQMGRTRHSLLLKSHNSIPDHSGTLEIQCPVGGEMSVGVSVVNRTLEFGGKLFQKGDP